MTGLVKVDCCVIGPGPGMGYPAGPRRSLGTMGDEEGLDAALGLGELAQLTVNNEAEAAYDVSI
jgi:hypothetical protein